MRKARADEAGAIAALVNRAYRVEDFFKVGDRTDEADIAGHMSRGVFLVAEGERGELQGSVFVSIDGEEGYFGLLSVEPGGQRRGLGRALVEAAEGYCAERGCRVMTLSVVDLREELPPWYRRQGYRENGRREPFPADKTRIPCSFLYMEKELAPACRAAEEVRG